MRLLLVATRISGTRVSATASAGQCVAGRSRASSVRPRHCTRLSRGSLLPKAPTLTRAAISERVTQTAESISSGDALCYSLHPVENSSATGEKSWTNGGNPRSGRCSNSATQSVDVLWAALGGPATGLIPLPFNNESRSLSNRGDLFCVCFAWLRCDCLVFPQSRSSGDRRCA